MTARAIGAVPGQKARGVRVWAITEGSWIQAAAALRALLDVDIEYPFTKALRGFRPSGRRSPFKTAPGGFVSNRTPLRRTGAAAGAPRRSRLRGYGC